MYVHLFIQCEYPATLTLVNKNISISTFVYIASNLKSPQQQILITIIGYKEIIKIEENVNGD